MAIHVELEGEVKNYPVNRSEQRGTVERRVHTEVEQREDASLYIEITEGHPNLDAWSPDYRVESLASLAEQEGNFGDWKPVKGTWEIDIHATPTEWVPTIMEYTEERPNTTVKETIERFIELEGFTESSLKSLLITAEEYSIDLKQDNLVLIHAKLIDQLKG